MLLRNRCRLIIFILLCCLPASWSLAQSDAAAQITLQSPASVVQGAVTLQFSVTDQRGLSPVDLSPNSIKLGEPASNISLTSKAQLPLTLAIIVNLSSGSDLDLIQNTLRAYFKDYYQPQDNVTFYVLGPEANKPQVTVIKNQADAAALIDGLKRSPNLYSITPTLKAALTALQAAGSSAPRQVLYIGSFLNDPQEANASSIFAGAAHPF